MIRPGHLFIFMFLIAAAPTHFSAADDLDEGAYLVKIAGCADCRSPHSDAPFGGGLKLVTPFGAFYTPNITPDGDTGIGRWDFPKFQRAMRDGVSPGGQYYYPAFPYRSYTKITDPDLEKIWAYLVSQRPVYKENHPQQLSYPYNQRWGLFIWQGIFLQEGPAISDPTKSAEWNRGAYIAEALAHCAECHTPRNAWTGALELSKWMAGSAVPINGRLAPNLTRDVITGRGSWSGKDWERFLLSGRNPQGKYPSAEMAQVINNTSSLTPDDRAALVSYMMSLPAIRSGENVP